MKLTQGGRLERPNICWICTRTPEVGSAVVDTEKHFDGYPFNLNGRMYVCEKCATQIAGFFDLVDKNSVEIAQTAQARAEATVRGIKFRVDALVKDLQNLAVDPSVFMEEENVPTTGRGSGTVGESTAAGTDPGASDDREGEASSVGSESGSPAGGSATRATAQPRTRKRAGSTA